MFRHKILQRLCALPHQSKPQYPSNSQPRNERITLCKTVKINVTFHKRIIIKWFYSRFGIKIIFLGRHFPHKTIKRMQTIRVANLPDIKNTKSYRHFSLPITYLIWEILKYRNQPITSFLSTIWHLVLRAIKLKMAAFVFLRSFYSREMWNLFLYSIYHILNMIDLFDFIKRRDMPKYGDKTAK